MRDPIAAGAWVALLLSAPVQAVDLPPCCQSLSAEQRQLADQLSREQFLYD